MAVAHNKARRLAITLMTAAGVLFLLSLWVVLVYHNDIDVAEPLIREMALNTWILTFAAVLAVILVALVVLFATTATRPAVEGERVSGREMEAEGLTVPLGQMLLRCGQCGNTFTALEISERPYYSTCPQCGARGVLNY